jgi:hypothetical protein
MFPLFDAVLLEILIFCLLFLLLKILKCFWNKEKELLAAMSSVAPIGTFMASFTALSFHWIHTSPVNASSATR